MNRLAPRGQAPSVPTVPSADHPRRPGRLAWAGVAAAVLAASVLLGSGLVSALHRSADVAADLGAGPVVAVPAVARTAPPPVALQVPALGLDLDLGGLHTDRDGALQVDPDPAQAGWYVDGPAPGDPGPAVLAGHKDSRSGPGVFGGMERLRPGDRLTVQRSDGTSVAFAVREVATYAKRDFPTAKVYVGDGRPSLRVITCGGAVDPGTGRYLSNTIVFADEVPGTPPVTG